MFSNFLFWISFCVGMVSNVGSAHAREPILCKRFTSSEKVRRAHIQHKADANGPHWKDQDVADAFLCSRQTIEKYLMSQAIVTKGVKREKLEVRIRKRSFLLLPH